LALTEITLYKFEISYSLSSYFVCFSIILSYNCIRFYDLRKTKVVWFKKWFQNQKKLLILICLLSLVVLGSILASKQFDIRAVVILFPFGLMTFFYVIPIRKTKNFELSFRNTSYIKILSISIAWAGVTVLFPVYEAGRQISQAVQIEFLQRFLILFVVLIPFDVRDMKRDLKSLRTLPQVFGLTNSKLIGTLFLIAFLAIEILVNEGGTIRFKIRVLIISITGLFLWFSSVKRNKYYTGFFVEGIPILWFILISLFLHG